MSDRLSVSIDAGIADVRLNRPEKRNALDIATFLGLAECAAQLAADPGVRAVVLSGAGPSFCAGIDTTLFTGGAEGPVVNLLDISPHFPVTHAQAAVYGWRAMPVPVIAALRGHAFGGGFQLAIAADIRFATAETKLSVMETKWGLVPDMCGTQLLPPLVGPAIAKELTWTGRVLSGEQAAELGIVTHLADDPLADALALAREIAGRSPDAVRGAKRLLEAYGTIPELDGYKLEAEIQAGIIGKPNQIEAITATVTGRPPVFVDPA